MTTFRSQRLETLLGARITRDTLTYEHLQRLRDGKVPEAADLDYKSVLYGNGDSAKRDLCSDAAAQANTQGGIVILGIEEDDQARVAKIGGVAISDAETLRMRAILASGIAPFPALDVFPVEDPDRPGMGCYVIAVPRSPRYPHGIPVNDGFRWPRRNGASTIYMSEPELATAYRTRFSLAHDQISRAAAIEKSAGLRRAIHSGAWVAVSLVPDLPGDMIINWDTFSTFKNDFERTDPVLLSSGGNTWGRIVPGAQCLMLDTGLELPPAMDRARSATAQLYTDGAGVFSMHLRDVNDQNKGRFPCRVDEKWLAIAVLSGLRLLARYARDYAYAGGDVLLGVRLGWADPPSVELGTTGPWGSQQLGVFSLSGARAERAVPLDALAADGPPLVATAAHLVGDIMRAFGHPDVLHITTDGRIAPSRWCPYEEAITTWATTAGVETL